MLDVILELHDERMQVIAVYVSPHPKTGGKWRVGYIRPHGKAALFGRVGTKDGKAGEYQHGLSPSQAELVTELAERQASDDAKLKEILATDASRQLEALRRDDDD